jgi:hypothetical protein
VRRSLTENASSPEQVRRSQKKRCDDGKAGWVEVIAARRWRLTWPRTGPGRGRRRLTLARPNPLGYSTSRSSSSIGSGGSRSSSGNGAVTSTIAWRSASRRLRSRRFAPSQCSRESKRAARRAARPQNGRIAHNVLVRRRRSLARIMPAVGFRLFARLLVRRVRQLERNPGIKPNAERLVAVLRARAPDNYGSTGGPLKFTRP